MDELTRQEYQRRRRKTLDTVVDHGELLICMAQRYDMRQKRRKWVWEKIRSVPLAKMITLFSALAVGWAAVGDKVIHAWEWLSRGNR